MRLGASATVTHVVTAADTALVLGSGDVEVLGTPKVVALCEQATVAAVATHLGEGQTTVGTRVEVEHRRPTRVGREVTAEATLREVDGNRLVFDVRLLDGGEVAARGTVARAIVDRGRFSSAV